ncbi:lytic transglycosylase domain-containing protein [Rhodoblastus acidophilus]|uniref:Lytic transglycosylase domain-containing protein n=1 Tax=Candidatus Rhodoblastus alkanivorans TaxID=2954117 RepID=A0ABS9Z6I2_9HYPH|nr:lytic transglycosylase domain-containing protein [Candidatus Rhodoblastus alkanivorans]MCI4679680.1 lytic transglycosylase domain-containing protein [Candidatus Rhodoblastus alkanivorans]MCI4683258.1 lytic transglycosylase domain-containing protein [Candidatus Rhodoblastus alkanivorans]
MTGLAVVPAHAGETSANAVEYASVAKSAIHRVAAVPLPPQHTAPAPAASVLARRIVTIKKVCDEISLAARTYHLPKKFLLRLIWQESRFNPKAVSPAGAQGIAQFMPATAQWRGLDDPFDWSLSIEHSGRWLGELRQQFGNLGLAAAAYNAGPGRVQDWLAGAGGLPEETRAYVRTITGRNADDWIGQRDASASVETRLDDMECPPRSYRPMTALSAEPDAAWKKGKHARSAGPKSRVRPWALQLIGDRSKSAAMQQYATMRRHFPTILGSHAPEVVARRIGGRRPTFWYQIRVSEVTRQSAASLCSRLKSAGGDCLVIPN